MTVAIEQLLYEYVLKDDEKSLKLAVEQQPEIINLCIDEIKNTALLLAAEKNKLSCLEVLLQQESCQINYQNLHGRTALHFASFQGHIGAVQLLIESSEIQIDLETKNGCTGLYFAACKSHASIARLLIEKGANVSSITSTGSSPLLAAAFCGNLILCQLLINNGAKINAINGAGLNSIHVAINAKHLTLANILMEISKQQEKDKSPRNIQRQDQSHINDNSNNRLPGDITYVSNTKHKHLIMPGEHQGDCSTNASQENVSL